MIWSRAIVVWILGRKSAENSRNLLERRTADRPNQDPEITLAVLIMFLVATLVGLVHARDRKKAEPSPPVVAALTQI
jgi:hypothetical protein